MFVCLFVFLIASTGAINTDRSIDITSPHTIHSLALKMAFLYEAEGLVAQGYANFQKMVWMAIIHFRVKLPSIPIFGNLNTLAQQGMHISSDFLRNPILIYQIGGHAYTV